ncbi:probable leucine-rich repeat receptor-like protein kinase IMK3 [Phragmites australis]|uniref:probable leucine-rich repeat receptor-like protein kinase IMK3 n=1 Tax=Phragmites australis TaxID=29695 RepID=UPI002D77146C|nr:probable leucine-rich repeat receptor-like protein kinase IMK3 [Phragmites australis]
MLLLRRPPLGRLLFLVHCFCAAATLLLLAPPPAAAAQHHHRHPAGDGVVISQADYQGLQAIKHDLSDPYGFLRSWNDSGLTACSGAWAGIKCVRGTVVAITLPWRGLGGSLSQRGIGQLTGLRRLSIHDNAIAGPIPAALGFLPELRGVYLFNNLFSGAVPASIGACVALQSFDASNNRLTGSIPPAVANSTKLIRLNLSRNEISGGIPAEVAASPSLLFLDLSYNNLSGPIPDAFAGSKTAPSSSSSLKEAITGSYQLVFLSLAHNSLDGPIPESLAGLKKLQEVDLAGNKLNGTIPDQLGSLADLKTLDLSGNVLTGEIPASLANLTATLQSFNVSYNNLSGAVPASLAQKFGEPSFTGNILLCGYSASAPCPASPSPAPSAPASPAQGAAHRKFSTKELILIIAGIVVGVLILLLLCCLLLCFLKRKRSSSSTGTRSGKQAAKEAGGAGAAAAGRGEKPGSGAAEVESGGDMGGKLVHFDGPLAFTADDLLCATAEIMGKSTYGTVYKATLEDSSLVAVKRLREKITKGHKEFEAEAAVLGKIRHPNLLALRAYYLGPKGEKLLVFDYMPNGSLSAFLHARAPNTPVDWATRMTIAKGTARGLAYLHDDMSIVHGNLTASNVLLDEQSNPKIADFGLSRLMTAAANSNVLAAAGALGYRAPELSKLKKASAKTDVYSLGVIILELLTGKSPADTTNGMDLPQWVASIVKEEWTSEVFDLELMRDAAGDELMDTLKLALHCVDPSPSVRPEAREVLRQLEQIRPGPEGGAGPSEEGGGAHVPVSAGDDE